MSTAREFPGSEVDKAVAAEMGRAEPRRAALMVQAIADRKETVVLTTILQIAAQGPKQVRAAAVEALGRVGDASCVSVLLGIALDSDMELAQTAKATLARLPGDAVDSQLVARLRSAEGKSYPMLIEVVGKRRSDAVPELLTVLEDSDGTVRRAALTALGETVALKGCSELVAQVVAPRHIEDVTIAQQALRAASVRMPDREACAAELAVALTRSPAATKSALLEILAEVGGTKALNTLGAAAKSEDRQLQDTASRLLGKWNSVDAAPVLLDLAKSGPGNKYQVRALRGYIGLARKFATSAPQCAEMCQKAWDLAGQPAEQKLVLDVLRLRPSADALRLAIGAMEVVELKDHATQTALLIAQKIGGKSVDVSQLLSGAGLAEVKLEIVKAEYGNGSVQKDVTAVVRKAAGSWPLITLASPNYNASFGGDPLPGVEKGLKIEYRINGKAAEASFAENSLILLPVPR